MCYKLNWFVNDVSFASRRTAERTTDMKSSFGFIQIFWGSLFFTWLKADKMCVRDKFLYMTGKLSLD